MQFRRRICLLGLAVLLVACSRAVPERPNVVLVTIDTLRADHVHAAGYPRETTPFLDALASEGAFFTQAVTPAPQTAPAHASLLTGLRPPTHGVRANGIIALAPELTTLAELLAGAGYRTGAFVGSFVLDRKFGLDQGFEVYDDAMGPPRERPGRWYGNRIEAGFDRRAEVVTQAALAWLAGVGSEPFFLWVHYYDPHAPYEPPDAYDVFPIRAPLVDTWKRWVDGFGQLDGPERADLLRDAASRRELEDRLLPDLISLYDAEIRYADAQLGRLLAALSDRGVADETLLIVTSDHGESLAENHYFFRHGWYLYDNVLRVPLVLRYPPKIPAGTRIAEQVELTDLFATVVAAVPELRLPAAVAGSRDLLALAAGEEAAQAEDFAYAETFLRQQLKDRDPLFALRTPRWKYVDNLRDEPDDERSLFDLAADPLEHDNRIGEQPELASSLARRLRSLRDRIEAPGLSEANRLEPDADTSERLRALGYAR